MGMFKAFAEKHYDAAFAFKCLATVAIAAVCCTSGAGALLVLAALPYAKNLFGKFMDQRQEAKQNIQGREFDNNALSAPRMGSR
jgi:1,4-dihydroxy-2-naphthoate octaprenyltransferase